MLQATAGVDSDKPDPQTRPGRRLVRVEHAGFYLIANPVTSTDRDRRPLLVVQQCSQSLAAVDASGSVARRVPVGSRVLHARREYPFARASEAAARQLGTQSLVLRFSTVDLHGTSFPSRRRSPCNRLGATASIYRIGGLMRLRPEVLGIAVAVPAAILFAACGSSSTTTTTSSTVASTNSASVSSRTHAAAGNLNSCSVVTRAEAASAIGESVTPGVLGNATVEGGLACVFYGPSAPTPTTPNVAQPDSVRVVLVQGPHASSWYDDYKSKVHAQSVTGLGDHAYYDGYASLSILKGDHYLRIAVDPAHGLPSLSDEEKLAAAILPKL